MYTRIYQSAAIVWQHHHNRLQIISKSCYIKKVLGVSVEKRGQKDIGEILGIHVDRRPKYVK